VVFDPPAATTSARFSASALTQINFHAVLIEMKFGDLEVKPETAEP
jgi:hypothetical protein